MSQHDGGSGGWLNSVPLSWLCHFMYHLPPSGKLAIFRTSKWLARHVVYKSSNITLRLTGASKDARARQDVIMKLLEGCQHLSIDVDEQGACILPFSDNICTSLASLSISWPDRSNSYHTLVRHCGAFLTAITSYNWTAFANVTELRLCNFFNVTRYGCEGADVLPSLCYVLEIGALPQLSSLQFAADRGRDVEKAAAQRLAQALGPRLTQLSTNVPVLVQQTKHLSNLELLHIHEMMVPADVVPELCAHPKLDTVTIGQGCHLEGDYSQLECTWRTIIMEDASTDTLECLPWKGLKQLKFVRKLRAVEHGDDPLLDLHELLSGHGVNILVEPVKGKFEVVVCPRMYCYLCRGCAKLVSCMCVAASRNVAFCLICGTPYPLLSTVLHSMTFATSSTGRSFGRVHQPPSRASAWFTATYN